MVQFSQRPIIEEGLDNMLSDEEKARRIKKALEIHMLQNREAHMQPQRETLFSFTQGDPNAVVGKSHGLAQDDEKKRKSIEQEQMEQQQKMWESKTGHDKSAPVRTCPCCVNFLKQSFGLSDKEVDKFIGGVEGGPASYQGGAGSSDSYGSGNAGYGASDSASSGTYIGASGASYSSSKDDDDKTKYS